jgi:hypothetical protein
MHSQCIQVKLHCIARKGLRFLGLVAYVRGDARRSPRFLRYW